MTEKLRLGPLPRSEVVRLTVTLPATVKGDLDRYAELFGAAHGEAVDPSALVPHILAAFMEHDRAFWKARQAGRTSQPSGEPSSASTNAAISSTSEVAADGSSR